MTTKPKVVTAVWNEKPLPDNPFYPGESLCRGFDFYGELMGNVSWTRLLWLHLRGELPGERETGCFDLLLSAVMNPGPRDPQNQTAMAAAVGGCPVGGSLMAGFGTSQGSLEGGGAVEACMTMLDRLAEGTVSAEPETLAAVFGEGKRIPGFGNWFGESDHRAPLLAGKIGEKGGAGPRLSILRSLEDPVRELRGEGLRLYGVFAAGLGDLGFTPQQGHGLFMLSGGAGMLAFLCEQYARHWTEFPHWFGYGEYRYEP